MKLVRSNGLLLEVRDVSAVLYALAASPPGAPLPLLDEIASDDNARDLLRMLRETGDYRRVK
jgi:hypothetical protein